VTEKAYEVAHLDELDRFPVDEEGLVWRPVRRRLGIRAFGTNAYTAEKAGDRVVEEHFERDGHEELYLVANGRATFTLGEDEIDASAGTLVYATPGTKRGAVAVEPETTIVAFGAKPGVPHEISGWEGVFVAFGYLRKGEEEKGRQAMAMAVAERPNDWQGQYNAACFESLTGNKEAAIAHLQRAIELDPKAREFAQKDTDFDWLRDDPEFPA
jgi:mannose-6-phosphate isomerase-like protein (cupin superfamily)